MDQLPVENVQSYPRPPSLERVAQVLRIRFNGETIAQTDQGWRVCETHHAPSYYLPPGAFAPGVLAPAQGRSFCEWKGVARYWDVRVGDMLAARAAWSYPGPTPDFAPIADHVAVYAGRMEACHVGDFRVAPQPGEFYGGWVTPNLTGRIKGSPGTEGW